MTTHWDIETGPQPDDQLAKVKPEFKAPANYKDPIKIATAKLEAEAEWRDRCALDVKYGQVLAIGLLDDEMHILTGPEPAMIEAFWKVWNDGPKMVGFCIKSFDLPFLVQRSWILGVHVPIDLLEGRYWNRRLVDLQEIWTCFSHRTEGNSLDAICRCVGIGGKSGNGKDFAKLFATDRKAALDYLQTDLTLTAKLAARLGVQ